MNDPMTNNTERSVPEVVVTQADRDRAADYWKGLVNTPELNAMREGKRDDNWKIQVLARHRTEAEARATRSGEVLPLGSEFIDEEALDRWRTIPGGHDFSANNTTVRRLVATIDYLRAALSATRSPGDVEEAEVERLARLAFEVVGYRPPNGEPWTWEHVVAEKWDIVRRLRERARLALNQEQEQGHAPLTDAGDGK
jgi:hypothetical protein